MASASWLASALTDATPHLAFHLTDKIYTAMALLRLGYHVRLSDMPLTRGLFAGTSLEVGNAWQRPQDVWTGAKKTGFSLYLGADTAIGPVYTAILHSPGVGPTLMLFVGRP